MNVTNVTGQADGSCQVEPQHMFVPVVVCLVLMLGLFLNIFSMWVFWCRTPQWKAGTVLQFHLAISDVIVCPLAPLIVVYFVQEQQQILTRPICWLKIILITVHFYGSILFLTLISIHRYVSVVYHSQDSRMKQKDFVQKLCLAVWVAMLLNGMLSAFLLDSNSTTENITLCSAFHLGQNTDLYFAFNFIIIVLGFLIPFTVLVVCYSRLVRSVSGISVCHQKGKLIKSKSRKMVTICLVIFGLCFMPTNVIRIVTIVVKKWFPNKCTILLHVETAYYVAWIFSLVNCCLDPLIYCFASQKFTKALRSSLRKIGVGVRTARQDIEQDSGLTTHIDPAAGTIKRETMAFTDTL
ncbi:lysophosphatidic acid receptor 6-like [Brachyhypopomus gauderio]|uniref:lysophosphatidic acid receptor 6-like n=1 Tax=Brachyhypopomus gauderio TaxID=698409 RepID=UPI00404306E2